MTPATLDLTMRKGITFGPYLFACKDENGVAVDLTGYQPFAEVRATAGGALRFSLAPVLSDAVGGVIAIPKISDENTKTKQAGRFAWDLILENPEGDRLGPFVQGAFTVEAVITQPGRA